MTLMTIADARNWAGLGSGATHDRRFAKRTAPWSLPASAFPQPTQPIQPENMTR